MATEVMKLNSGFDMPIIGLGTWLSKAGEVKGAVKAAIACGYRLIDCAYIYGNEVEIGEALAEVFKEGLVRREDLFIISKLWNTRHHPDEVKSSLQESLDRLQINYIDLYLIHWPMAFKRGPELFPRDDNGDLMYEDIHYIDTWKVMEQCVDEGLIRSVGLSNFNSQQIQHIIDHGRIAPAALEIEIHPYFDQHRLVDFCKERNMAVIGYSSFGSPNRPWAEKDKEQNVLEDGCIVTIARRLAKTPAQVILRWLYQRRIVCIPKSVTPERIQQNLQIFDFELSSSDFDAVNKLNKNLRIGAPTVVRNGVKEYRDKNAPHFPLLVEF